MEQPNRGPMYIRYSRAFKQKVVEEIEAGELTIAKAQRVYDIRGGETIQKWIKLLGKNHLLNRIVRIEMKDENDKIKENEKKIRQLQAALSDAHLKIVMLESTITVMEREEKREEDATTKSTKA
jgi:transposase-like protein